MEVKGTIDSMWTKDITTKFGQKAVHYANVNGQEINLGFKTQHAEGEYVTLQVEHKFGELQVARPGAKPSTSGSQTNAAPATKSAPARGNGAFPIDATNGQVSIIRQSSLNRAVEATNAMMKEGVVSFSNVEDYMATVWELAYQFTDFGTGQREVKLAKAQAGYTND